MKKRGNKTDAIIFEAVRLPSGSPDAMNRPESFECKFVALRKSCGLKIKIGFNRKRDLEGFVKLKQFYF